MPYAEIFADFPPELRLPIARLVDALKEDLAVRRSDFGELKAVVRDLAEAQKRTENRVEELAEAQKELAEAQKRTENRLEELAEAQKRTENRLEELAEAQKRTENCVEELAEAQKRTENRMEELAKAQIEFAQTQMRIEDELTLFRRTFTSQIGGLGARWGVQTEEAFRQGMRAILLEVGFKTERFLDYDSQGEVFGRPEQIELDVVIKNGKVILVEVKSALDDKAAVYAFARKAEFYSRKTGRQVDRKFIVTSYADARAHQVGKELGIEVCTDVNALH